MSLTPILTALQPRWWIRCALLIAAGVGTAIAFAWVCLWLSPCRNLKGTFAPGAGGWPAPVPASWPSTPATLELVRGLGVTYVRAEALHAPKSSQVPTAIPTPQWIGISSLQWGWPAPMFDAVVAKAGALSETTGWEVAIPERFRHSTSSGVAPSGISVLWGGMLIDATIASSFLFLGHYVVVTCIRSARSRSGRCTVCGHPARNGCCPECGNML